VDADNLQGPFRIEVRDAEHAVVFTLSGELDLASAPELEHELQRAIEMERQLVVVDLRGLGFMDSSGIAVLVKAHQRARTVGRSFAVVKGSPQVERLFEITGVDEHFTLLDSPDELISHELQADLGA
jgi:anti-sigma B factor antagonist